MPTSANVLNYFEGKGIVTFRESGSSIVRDLGNAPSFKLTPAVEKFEHKSSRTGVATVDRTLIREKKLTLEMTLDEITLLNLRLLFLGDTIDSSTAGAQQFGIFQVSSISGEVILSGTNDIGARFKVILPSTSFEPGEGFDFIGEELGVISLTGTVNADSTTGEFGDIIITRDGQ